MTQTFRERYEAQRKQKNEVQTIIRPNYVFHSNYGSQLDCESSDTDRGRYYSIPGGIRYPSVTTVLSQTKSESAKESLNLWMERMGGEEAAEKEKVRAGNRGSILHDLTESFILDRPRDYASNQLFLQIYPQLKRINNIHLLESALYSNKLKIAGRVDNIAEFDGILSVIDFKSSSKDKEAYHIEDYYIQETAYSIMYAELYGLKVKQIVTLISTETTGKAQVFIENPLNFIKPLKERVDKFYGGN